MPIWRHETTYFDWRSNWSSINGTGPTVARRGRIFRMIERTTQVAPETVKNWLVIIITVVIFSCPFGTYSKLMVNSFAGCQKLSTEKKRDSGTRVHSAKYVVPILTSKFNKTTMKPNLKIEVMQQAKKIFNHRKEFYAT